ncbi:cell division protein FtsL [Evansella vedderi]|uniref:Cell division protein FtsL n=1 Tax=Evansella vedderi TaxID=38282 RepID=A0ABT9ZSI3_9BACI|nr:cell division protein FtsL [Evansella vedderi]MDQ0253824.1 cell division protein FtsL [Evansella vedderi]
MSPLVQRQIEQPMTQPAGKPEKKQVHKKSGISKGEKVIYTGTLVAIVIALYFVLSNYASIYIANHQIQQSESEIQTQLKVNEGLSLQVMELSDPERILSEAKAMGMILDENNVRFTHTND